MDELNLLTRRREEVAGMIANYRKHIAELEAELVELETAGKVIARLSGAAWPPAGSANQLHATGIAASTEVGSVKVLTVPGASPPTMPEMIIAVLHAAHRQGLRGLSPKEMAERIREKFPGAVVKGDYVASIAWRTGKQGRIRKIGEGLYALPEEKEATDLLSREDQSEASGSNPAQGGEARPGGGT